MHVAWYCMPPTAVTPQHTGIGLGIARRLAQEGAAVMISSRKAKNVEDTVAALREEGLDVKGVACHVGSLEQVQRLIKVHAALASSTRIGHLLHGLLTVPSERKHGCMRPCSTAAMEGGLGCNQLVAYQGRAMALSAATRVLFAEFSGLVGAVWSEPH